MKDRFEADFGKQKAAIAALSGAQLSSVEFIMDYLILGFGANGALTTIVWPEIYHEKKRLLFSEPSYRDELCALITVRVAHAAIDDEDTIRFLFENGVEMNIVMSVSEDIGERVILTSSDHSPYFY